MKKAYLKTKNVGNKNVPIPAKLTSEINPNDKTIYNGSEGLEQSYSHNDGAFMVKLNAKWYRTDDANNFEVR